MKALDLIIPNIKENYKHTTNLNKTIIEELSTYKDLHINSTINSISNIINISLPKIKPETFIHSLDNYNIYISTKSACSSNDTMSNSVYAVTKNRDYANTSIRISLSHLTTKEEITKFLKIFNTCYNHLTYKD